MKRFQLFIIILITGLAGFLTGCIEDGFTSSPSDQPTFSVDTLNMGLIFTEQPSTTHRFTVYNHAGKSLSISNISLSGDNASLFRLNVDGFSGREFHDVEIRAKDSIYVFVEATLPANNRNVPVEVCASLDFLTNGVERSVVVAAQGRDVRRIGPETFTQDTRLDADKPYQIFDSLVVAQGTTLTIDPGAELFFHDGAMLIVRGTLKAVGDVGREIVFSGDRTGKVAANIPFDIMSRQWTGMFFTNTSRNNELSLAHVCNTSQGIIVDGTNADNAVELKMVNSRLRNSGDMVLEAHHANIAAYGCEFAEAANGAVLLNGGEHIFNHCTFSNNYLFSAIGGPIVRLNHLNDESTDESAPSAPFLKADISNSIIYGMGADISHGDLTGTNVFLKRCSLKSPGDDDENFISCLWDTDPGFLTVRSDYYFDYRVYDDSPVVEAAFPQLTCPEAAIDRFGSLRGSYPTLGAYQDPVEH